LLPNKLKKYFENFWIYNGAMYAKKLHSVNFYNFTLGFLTFILM
jgi:hypothetical protein